MIFRFTIACVCFVAAMSIAACSSTNTSNVSGTPSGPTDAGAVDASAASDAMAMNMKTSAPSAQSQSVLSQINGYASWPKFPENQTPTASQSHMKMWVLTYHNDVVTQAMANHTLPLPDGAIIVKENYAMASDKMPMALTIMSKQGGSWYWIESTGDGKEIIDDSVSGAPYEGANVTMCVGCHSQKKSSNDWVFMHDFAADAGL